MNSLRVNPYDTNGAVLLKLNNNDRLFINTDKEDETLIEFKPESGAVLIVQIYKSGLMNFDYTCQFGKNYKYKSNAINFKIPNLIYESDTGKLVADSGEGTKNFAVYSSTPVDGKATLEVPSLNLKLNLNYFDESSCLSSAGNRLTSSSSKGKQQELISNGRPKWDYA